MQNSPPKDAKQLLFDATKERAKNAEKGFGIFTTLQRFFFPTPEDLKRARFVKEWKMLEKEEMDVVTRDHFYDLVQPIHMYTCLERKQQWKECVLSQQEKNSQSTENAFPSAQDVSELIQKTTEAYENIHVLQAMTKRILQLQDKDHFQHNLLQRNLHFMETNFAAVSKDATLATAIAAGKFDPLCKPCGQHFTNLQNCILKGFQNSISGCGGSFCRGQLAEFRTTPNNILFFNDYFLNYKWNQFTKCLLKKFKEEGEATARHGIITKSKNEAQK